MTLSNEQIAAVRRARDFLKSLNSISDVAHKIEALSANIKRDITKICRDDGCSCFDDTQVDVLSKIGIHVALLNDPNMDPPKGFRSMWLDFKKLPFMQKFIVTAALLPLLALLGTGAKVAITAADAAIHDISSKAEIDRQQPVPEQQTKEPQPEDTSGDSE